MHLLFLKKSGELKIIVKPSRIPIYTYSHFYVYIIYIYITYIYIYIFWTGVLIYYPGHPWILGPTKSSYLSFLGNWDKYAVVHLTELKKKKLTNSEESWSFCVDFMST